MSAVQCPDLTCDLSCTYGLKKDGDGCEICQCAAKPDCPEDVRPCFSRCVYVSTDSLALRCGLGRVKPIIAK